MPDPLLVSLIVATVDRTSEPEALLRSLAALPRRDFEVILADQNVDERLAPCVERFSDAFPIRRLKIRERNANAARNAGAREARGAWVGFPDDDCRYRPDTVETLRKLSARPRLRLLSGDVLDDDGKPIIGGGSGPAFLTQVSSWGRIAESCMFLERERFAELGGFDCDFGPGGRYHAAEGLELALRFLARSPPGEGFYDPALACLHPRKTSARGPAGRARGYHHGIGVGAAAGLHPRPVALAHLGWSMTKALAAAVRAPRDERVAHLGRLTGLVIGLARGGLARAGFSRAPGN